MTGLETSLALILTNLVRPGIIDYGRMVELMAVNPRTILRLDQVSIAAGSVADLTVFDPEATWTVDESFFESKSANSRSSAASSSASRPTSMSAASRR